MRRAVDRLINACTVAYGSRCQHTHRACDLRGLVGKDISKKVGSNHHIKTARIFDQKHSCGIYKLVLDFYIWVLIRKLLNHLSPQTASFDYVGLVYRAEFFATRSGCLESFSSDSLYFKSAVLSNVIGSIAIVLSAFFSKVDVSCKFSKE